MHAHQQLTLKWLVYVYWGSVDQIRKSETNKLNALSQKIHSTCGAKSTARMLTEMDLQELREKEARERETTTEQGGSLSDTQPIDDDPKYIKVYTRLKRRPDGFDPEAEEKLQKFRDLHEK